MSDQPTPRPDDAPFQRWMERFEQFAQGEAPIAQGVLRDRVVGDPLRYEQFERMALTRLATIPIAVSTELYNEHLLMLRKRILYEKDPEKLEAARREARRQPSANEPASLNLRQAMECMGEIIARRRGFPPAYDLAMQATYQEQTSLLQHLMKPYGTTTTMPSGCIATASKKHFSMNGCRSGQPLARARQSRRAKQLLPCWAI